MDMFNFYERPFRAKIVPAKIWIDLDKYINDPIGLGNYAKKWRTKVEWFEQKSTASIYQTHIAVGGEYNATKRQCVIIIHTSDFDKFKFSQDAWDRFKFKFIQTLLHEMIHFMQYDRRADEWSNYVVPYKRVGVAKKDAERRYLSEFDEIQAYAHCVLLDYKFYKSSIPVETLLARCKTIRDSNTLHYFLRTFDYDYRNNAAIPKIMQQIIKWERKYQKVNRTSNKS